MQTIGDRSPAGGAGPLPARAAPAGAGPGGRWAPFETGAAWLDLIATVGAAYGPAPVERLRTPGLLGAWLAGQRLAPVAAPGDADLDLARRLREALRGLGLAAAAGEPGPAAARGAVNDFLAADRPLRLDAAADGALALAPPASTGEALARLARQAAADLASPAAARLRTCAEPECRALFFDAGGRRRWCAADTCGVRNRVRAFRQRQRSGSLPVLLAAAPGTRGAPPGVSLSGSRRGPWRAGPGRGGRRRGW
jgi:predicted RNA-binding Zn ribbon-like protein